MLGKHKGKPAKEPRTDSGKPWSKLTPSEKGKEFDESLRDPRGYAERNFSGENQGRGGREAKHKK